MGVRGASTALRFRAYSLLLVLSAFCISTTASGFPSVDACPKFSNEEYLVLQEDLCIRDVDGNPVASAIAPRVAEVNGTTLERALKLLQSKGDAYVAVLYYANWCPFSRELRSLLDTLSSDFPAIYHIAVEDSAIQPSALSQHGVHSFPVLFLHNKTVKARYHGPRTVEAISEFYKAFTGTQALMRNYRDTDGMAFIKNLSGKGTLQGNNPNCPYPWAKSPEKWLRDDMYLLLATLFLVLRILVYLMPRLFISLKHYWVQKECSLGAHKVLLRRVLLREQGPVIRNSSKGSSFDSERVRKGKKVLSVPGWSPSPLAAVALAESSSSRPGSVEDKRENGHAFTSHFWG